MANLPEYIGLPDQDQMGYTASDVPRDYLKNKMLDQLMIAKIYPKKQTATANLSVFRTVSAWKEFTTSLGNYKIIPEHPDVGYLNVCLTNNQTQFTEVYGNAFDQSELLSSLTSITGNSLTELSFMVGGGKGLSDMAKGQGGLVADMASGAGKAVDGMINSVSGIAGDQLTRNLKEMARDPAKKLDFPKIWKGSSYQAQYVLNIRLHCPCPADDDLYLTTIAYPMIALLQFVTPQSKNGDLYQWPFLLELDVPGLVNMPAAYCSNIGVVKGGDVQEISYIGRPSTVDLQMTIENLYNVSLNSEFEPESGNQRPTLKKELEAISGKRALFSQPPGYLTKDTMTVDEYVAGRTIIAEDTNISTERVSVESSIIPAGNLSNIA